MKTSIRQYVAHYAEGLLASCWNAGITALKASFGQAIGAAVHPSIPVPTIHVAAAIFGGAALYEALTYFSENPIPILPITEPSPAELAVLPAAVPPVTPPLSGQTQ